jgi:hypothetical protein
MNVTSRNIRTIITNYSPAANFTGNILIDGVMAGGVVEHRHWPP